MHRCKEPAAAAVLVALDSHLLVLGPADIVSGMVQGAVEVN